MSRTLGIAELYLARRLVGDDIKREFTLDQNMLFVPIRLVVKLDKLAFLVEPNGVG
jgi:hypothetical protein